LVAFCERKGIYLICDDIYHKLVFDGQRPPAAYAFTAKDVETSRVISLNGVSKLYGLTGVRVGWVVAPRPIVEVMTNVQAQTATCVSVMQQAAAEGALTGLQSAVEGLRLTIQNNRDVMLRELSAFSGVRVTKPDGTFYCFPDFSAYGKPSVELAQFLLKKAMVVTVPGREFGLEGHLRLSFAGTVKEVTEGVERMKWALDPAAPNEIYIGNRKLVRDWL
jgi:aspartate aminotransferase